MPLSLHATTASPFHKMLGNVRALLTKAQAHCAATGIADADLIQASLAPDMLPFAYQVKSTVVHSIGAIEGVKKGVFSPDMTPPPDSFAALGRQIEGAMAALNGLDPAEVDSLQGQPMRFEMKGYRADFTAEQFLLTFSVPNFYFHAATAYDILRLKGLALGKVDFIGALALKKQG